MPFCPKCKYEYVAGITKCPDCDVDLVEKLPEKPEWDPNEVINLVTIAEFTNYIDAEMVKLQIEDAGIFCFLANETISQMWRPTMGSVPGAGLVNIEVQVREEDVAKALNALKEVPENQGAQEAE